MKLHLNKFLLTLFLSFCALYLSVNIVNGTFGESSGVETSDFLISHDNYTTMEQDYLARFCLIISFGLFVTSFVVLTRDNLRKSEKRVSMLNLDSNE